MKMALLHTTIGIAYRFRLARATGSTAFVSVIKIPLHSAVSFLFIGVTFCNLVVSIAKIFSFRYRLEEGGKLLETLGKGKV